MEAVTHLAKRTRRPAQELVRRAVREFLAREKAWEETLTYGRKKAKELGIRSETDILRAIKEYRRGDFSPYAPASRR